jgi:hypothetical protein
LILTNQAIFGLQDNMSITRDADWWWLCYRRSSDPSGCPTTRHIVGTLTRMPVVSAIRVHNSSKVASGW